MSDKVDFNILLFENYETLDAHGPAEIVSKLPEVFRIVYFSLDGGLVRSAQDSRVATKALAEIDEAGVLLVPGGPGTRVEVDNSKLIEALRGAADRAQHVLTVCTGSALMAKTGLLRGRKATTNKRAFDWVVTHGPDTEWLRKARWVVDGKYYTASGVSAGMDMTLGFISDNHGRHVAEKIARTIEYVWNSDKRSDPFSDNAVVLGP